MALADVAAAAALSQRYREGRPNRKIHVASDREASLTSRRACAEMALSHGGSDSALHRAEDYAL